jgi:transposase InsO family protein
MPSAGGGPAAAPAGQHLRSIRRRHGAPAGRQDDAGEQHHDVRPGRAREQVAAARPRPQAPCGPNQVWSYDFVFDHCANGQQLKCLTVTDEFTKEGLAIEVDGRIRSARVIEVLSRLVRSIASSSSIGQTSTAGGAPSQTSAA